MYLWGQNVGTPSSVHLLPSLFLLSLCFKIVSERSSSVQDRDLAWTWSVSKILKCLEVDWVMKVLRFSVDSSFDEFGSWTCSTSMGLGYKRITRRVNSKGIFLFQAAPFSLLPSWMGISCCPLPCFLPCHFFLWISCLAMNTLETEQNKRLLL